MSHAELMHVHVEQKKDIHHLSLRCPCAVWKYSAQKRPIPCFCNLCGRSSVIQQKIFSLVSCDAPMPNLDWE
jgi:hypothetical protein